MGNRGELAWRGGSATLVARQLGTGRGAHGPCGHTSTSLEWPGQLNVNPSNHSNHIDTKNHTNPIMHNINPIAMEGVHAAQALRQVGSSGGRCRAGRAGQAHPPSSSVDVLVALVSLTLPRAMKNISPGVDGRDGSAADE